MKQNFVSKSREETQNLAKDMARELMGGDIILLYGDLGAGKTTFMQGLAEGLGIKQRIISPTFIIMRKYEISVMSKALSIKNVYHLDLYRVSSESDLEGLGLQEILEDKNAIIAIEWPEKLGSFLPEKRIEIRLNTISDNEREIRINKV